MRKLIAIILLLVPSLVEAAVNPKAVIETTMGTFTCTLFKGEAPITVENFIGLAEGTKDWANPISHAKEHNTPLYDGTIFHRVIPGFMIQGGDPAGNGTGDPGYKFRDEFDSSLRFDRPGRLAMANSGPNTNGSQFFITEVPTPHLNGRHTIFGQCEPASLVTKITHVSRDPSNDKPFQPVRITHITIVQPGAAALAADLGYPTGQNMASTAAEEPVQLKEGQSPEEVEKALGKPEDITRVKETLIYTYPAVKVFFENGKLVDVQERKK